nr:ThiF family adenylyltransferase [Myxococcus sp. CA040A]
MLEVEPPLDLPHRVGDKELCFTSDANLLDRRNPEAVLHGSLLMVREHLEQMFRVDLTQEYLREAFAYWGALAKGRFLACAVSERQLPQVVQIFSLGTLPCAVTDEVAGLAELLPERSTGGLRQRSAIYLPVDPVSVNPSFRVYELATLEGLRKYAEALPADQKQVLTKCVEALDSAPEHFIVLALKRSEGERTLLGVLLRGIAGGHPLTNPQARAEVLPFTLLRMDRAYLGLRGGAGGDLQKRRVLLAGCGAVGGYIALALARAGVAHLSLVDPDFFSPDNVYRHVCGMGSLGAPKVQGLKVEITRTVPYVSVSGYPEEIGGLLRTKESWVREHDLIISATGHPTADLDLNEWSWSNPEHPPVLFTWLEPLGLGGHALLTHVPRGEGPAPGCMECLHARPYEGGPLENRAAFAMPGVTYTRDTLGCGSRYMPFADLDAQRTAELASRLALRALRHERPTATLVAWRGDPRAFEAAGYSVTPRFERDADAADFRREDCPCCGAA